MHTHTVVVSIFYCSCYICHQATDKSEENSTLKKVTQSQPSSSTTSLWKGFPPILEGDAPIYFPIFNMHDYMTGRIVLFSFTVSSIPVGLHT